MLKCDVCVPVILSGQEEDRPLHKFWCA